MIKLKDVDFEYFAFSATDPWGRCLLAWLRQCHERSGSDYTLSHYQQIITDFFSAEPAKLPDAYSREDCERFIRGAVHANGREGRTPGPGTTNNRLSAVNSYYTFCAAYTIADEQGLVRPVLRVPAPTLGIRQLKKVKTHHVLSTSNAERLLAVIPKDTEVGLKYRALFITYLFTARRSSEILAMRYRDIERVTITENGQRREIWQYYFYGKGRKMIRDAAQMPEPAAAAIFAYLEKSGRLATIQPDDYIFVANTDYRGRLGYNPKRPLTEQTIWTAAKRFARLAGLDEDLVNIHMWRHISARTRYDAGEDIRSIQNLLRHSSLQTTSVYLSEMTTIVDKGAVLLGARFANL